MFKYGLEVCSNITGSTGVEYIICPQTNQVNLLIKRNQIEIVHLLFRKHILYIGNPWLGKIFNFQLIIF